MNLIVLGQKDEKDNNMNIFRDNIKQSIEIKQSL